MLRVIVARLFAHLTNMYIEALIRVSDRILSWAHKVGRETTSFATGERWDVVREK